MELQWDRVEAATCGRIGLQIWFVPCPRTHTLVTGPICGATSLAPMFRASVNNLYRHGGDPLNSTTHPNAFTCGFHGSTPWHWSWGQRPLPKAGRSPTVFGDFTGDNHHLVSGQTWKSRSSIFIINWILLVTLRIGSCPRHLGLNMGMFYARDHLKGGFYLGCMWLIDHMAKVSPIPPMPRIHVLRDACI